MPTKKSKPICVDCGHMMRWVDFQEGFTCLRCEHDTERWLHTDTEQAV